MRPGIAKLWIEALRSGRYEQGTGSLRETEGKYCCLGVLCDLAATRGVGLWEPTSNRDVPYSFLGSDDTLPKKVMEWAGMSSNDGSFGGEDPTESSLMNLNDNSRFDFKQIANVIEANVGDL